MDQEIVMIDSDEAAQPHTMSGWKSRTGFFFAEEQDARYSGCTHIHCDVCGAPTPKGWLKCSSCRSIADEERYTAKPAARYDCGMVYSHTKDEYYNDLDEAEDSLDEHETLADLRLVICEAVHARPIDADYFADELPEGGDVPDAVCAAADKFNEAVSGIILSWIPGKYRVDLGD